MEELQLKAGRVLILDEQIYCFQPLEQYNLDTAAEDMENFIKFLGGKKVYLISDLRSIKKAIPKKIRDYLINALSNHLLGSAILVKSDISKIVVNLALAFKQSKYPRRLFSDDQPALEWLQKLKQKHQQED
ncbi:MAG: hypothetical protein MK212_02290 [Saprospiraceae bacterium]|nr:hypothetical protein [Saprospiraceae bacterium]